MKIKLFLKQETVLLIAAVLAVVSAFFVHPDAGYADYMDWHTLIILFSLMTVTAGLQRQGVFEHICRFLIQHTGSIRQIIFVLVGMCFFGSMFITNDVSLLTFVPFTFTVLKKIGKDLSLKLTVTVVCMQTIAANLGSMLTPIGNPQNLYLFSLSGMTVTAFIGLMLPYSLLSMLILIVWIMAICHTQQGFESNGIDEIEEDVRGDKKAVILYAILFLLCIMAVLKAVPDAAVLAAVFICALIVDRAALKQVDYSLLLTFAALFIFIGNLGRIPEFSEWLQGILAGREVPVAVLASQITSNVPAAILLSGFTTKINALIIGTNLGGLGTLIASMASLISYRQIAREIPNEKCRYFLTFTVSNVAILVLLLILWFFAVI